MKEKIKNQKGISLVVLIISILIAIFIIAMSAFFLIKNKKEQSNQVEYLESNKGISVQTISNNATDYFGKEVVNYNCPNKDGVSKWRIFYADDKNIYLIADDYISYENAPKSANNTVIRNTDYILSFNNVCKDYSGSQWILENSEAEPQRWLDKYFNYQTEDGDMPNLTCTKNHIKATAYLLDTKAWGELYKGDKAQYAVGAPTLQMYIDSYNLVHPMFEMSCSADEKGYYIQSGDNLGKSGSDYNEIYFKSDLSKAGGVFLASPGARYYYNDLHYSWYCGTEGGYPGLRPLVCLKSNVVLENGEIEGTFIIK